jgi:hypothetical protein
MASTISQMGVLYTQKGRAAEAIPLNLRSLLLRLEIKSPQAAIDLHWLSRQRSILGTEAFRALLAEHLGADGVTNILAALDNLEAEGQQSEATSALPAAG